jgi:RNA polymerase sigma-70 factor, ECF subfamily
VADDDDTELIQRVQRGDHAAFAALVVRYQRPVYNAAFWVLRRAEDAADVTQAVFLKVFERCHDYDPQYRFFSWLYRMAVNESLNWQRQRGREDELPSGFDAESDDGSPEQLLDSAQRQQRLREAVMRLPTEQRLVIGLRHFAELSYTEIAGVLQVDEKMVKSRLFEARTRLRARLGSEP